MNAEVFRLNAELERDHWWFAARRAILGELVREVLRPSRQTTLLDVGCGTGGNLAALADDYHCIGIDPSPEAIRLAKDRYPRIEFLHGEAPDELPPAALRAKLVLLADVLEHVPDDRALFARLVAAARPGAHFLVTVPADASLWSPHDERHGHYRRYDRARFEQTWHGLPLEPRLVSHFNTRLYPLVKLVRGVNRRRGAARGAHGTDLKLPPAPVNRVLERIFRGEGRVLKELLGDRRRAGYAFGVSLIALLRRRVAVASPAEPRDVVVPPLALPVDEPGAFPADMTTAGPS